MTRNEERLIWSAALALFSPQVLATWVLERTAQYDARHARRRCSQAREPRGSC